MPIAGRSIIADVLHRPGDVVWVPFPFVETAEIRERPALVIAQSEPAKGLSLLWVLMITSAANKGWRGDVSLEARHAECGLQVPCVVRTAKITTVDAAHARKCGALPEDIFATVVAQLDRLLPART